MNKYTRVASSKDGEEVKSKIDLWLKKKKDMLHYVQDVRIMRGMGQGLSDHHIVMRSQVGGWTD